MGEPYPKTEPKSLPSTKSDATENHLFWLGCLYLEGKMGNVYYIYLEAPEVNKRMRSLKIQIWHIYIEITAVFQQIKVSI